MMGEQEGELTSLHDPNLPRKVRNTSSKQTRFDEVGERVRVWLGVRGVQVRVIEILRRLGEGGELILVHRRVVKDGTSVEDQSAREKETKGREEAVSVHEKVEWRCRQEVLESEKRMQREHPSRPRSAEDRRSHELRPQKLISRYDRH